MFVSIGMILNAAKLTRSFRHPSPCYPSRPHPNLTIQRPQRVRSTYAEHSTSAMPAKGERPGTSVEPAASPKEKKLLMAKYKIFLEAIELQRRWRKEMEEANK